MSVLIKGMEMPTDHPLWIVVHPDGTVEANEVSASRPVGWQTLRNAAVSVPPHGDLIERDAAYDKIAEQEGGNYVDMDAVDMGLNETPTIIPAEETAQKNGGQDEAPTEPYDLLYEEGGYNSNGV